MITVLLSLWQLEGRYIMWKAKRERYMTGMGGELETTPRGKHKILHLAAITHRGPPQRTPRGLDVSVGLPVCGGVST